MSDSSQEKTEEATPKRVREARKKGQIAKSKDVTTVFILIVTVATIAALGTFMLDEMGEFARMALQFPANKSTITTADMSEVARSSFQVVFKIVAPIMAAAFFTALIVGYLQVGGLFTMEPLKPQFKKLNPIEGLKNMFKMKTLIELMKNIVKLSILLYIAYYVINKFLTPFLLSLTLPVEEGVKIGAMILGYYLAIVLLIFIFIALIDYFLQKKEHAKSLKMSKDEVKREYKQDEGDPLIKGQRKQLHQEMAMSDVAQSVRKSDVVVTNPTEVAVAIKYDSREMVAPELVAKGRRLYAKMIRELAEENDIPIMRNIPLAWALVELEVGDEVPEDLYQTVAEVLSFVYRLKSEKEHEALKGVQESSRV